MDLNFGNKICQKGRHFTIFSVYKITDTFLNVRQNFEDFFDSQKSFSEYQAFTIFILTNTL